MNSANELTGYCYKCSGSGRLPKHSHIAAGVCFACDGTGKLRYNARSVQSAPKGTERERMIRYLAARVEEAKRFVAAGEAERLAQWIEHYSTAGDHATFTETLGYCFRRSDLEDVGARFVAALAKLGITPADYT